MSNTIEQITPALRGVAEPQTTRPAAARAAERGAISAEARVEFSSFVLQGFLEAGLPKDLVGSSGGGTAGTMWRSMLIGELSKVLARTSELDLLGSTRDAMAPGSQRPAVDAVGGKPASGSIDGASRSGWQTKVTGT